MGCQGNNLRGEPCRARPTRDGRYCFKHDPALAHRQAEWNSTGGKGRSHAARAAKAIPPDLRGVLEILYETLAELRAGSLPRGRAMEVAALCRAIVAVYEVAAVEVELTELEAAIKVAA